VDLEAEKQLWSMAHPHVTRVLRDIRQKCLLEHMGRGPYGITIVVVSG
jgi:hypothetical protein